MEWSGEKGDIKLNGNVVAEDVGSPYVLYGLIADTEYVIQVVNALGESEKVTFKTKEVTYKEVTILCDFTDKVAGSVVENANIAKIATLNTIALPDDKSFYEFSSGRYAGIKQLNDSQVFNISNVTSGNMVQILLTYNIIDALERYDSNYFSDRGATTVVEKVAVAREEIQKISVSTYGFGRGATGTMLTMNVFNETSWNSGVHHTEATSSLLNQSVDSNCINDDGLVDVLVRAEAADTTVASAVAIDYAKSELTILVEED
ncbi:hypothetical protein [Enterococcus sp. BWR-S5]|uniref:hypothetical protein n=1 Tax=Enterococcus sp. BWR-S5 TaxID=2787714 RepID=UPI0019233C6C|nr:hypothetical protein [Enterococcus sp. BWR-S5]MBL1225366.1 hypothetical protein [Enterococcus sp. BWR-S5]